MKIVKKLIILILPFFLFSCTAKKQVINESDSENNSSEMSEEKNESEKEPVTEITIEEEFEIELEENQETSGG